MDAADAQYEPTRSSRTMLVRWPDGSGGEALCLARLVFRPALEPPVIVLTELAANSALVGLTTDFGGAATAALRALARETDLNPRAITWLAHHGEFSLYDAVGAPETLTEVRATFDGTRYHCELTDHRLLPAAASKALRVELGLEPVPAVLAGLRAGN